MYGTYKQINVCDSNKSLWNCIVGGDYDIFYLATGIQRVHLLQSIKWMTAEGSAHF